MQNSEHVSILAITVSLSDSLAQILKYTKTNVLIEMMMDHAVSNGQTIDRECVKANYGKFIDFIVQNLFEFNTDSIWTLFWTILV